MKWFKFIWIIVRHGKLFSKPIDFQKKRDEILESLPIRKVSSSNTPWNYSWLRKKLSQTFVFGCLLENIAYIKSLKKNWINIFYVDCLKIGYVRILKSGSTSILREIIPLIDTRLQGIELSDRQIDQLAYIYVSHELKGGYQLFTVVRNPIQRLLSVYVDLFKSSSDDFVWKNLLFGIFKKEMSFKKFVEIVQLIPMSLLPQHLISQTEIINACGGLEKVNAFRLDKGPELQSYLNRLGLQLHHLNKGVDQGGLLYYDESGLKIVTEIYAADFNTLGYSTEPEPMI